MQSGTKWRMDQYRSTDQGLGTTATSGSNMTLIHCNIAYLCITAYLFTDSFDLESEKCFQTKVQSLPVFDPYTELTFIAHNINDGTSEIKPD